MSYLPIRKIRAGGQGESAFLKLYENAQAKLKEVISRIEDTRDDSTLLAVETYADVGVPIEDVNKMLRAIRTDLLEVDREFAKAAEARPKT